MDSTEFQCIFLCDIVCVRNVFFQEERCLINFDFLKVIALSCTFQRVKCLSSTLDKFFSLAKFIVARLQLGKEQTQGILRYITISNGFLSVIVLFQKGFFNSFLLIKNYCFNVEFFSFYLQPCHLTLFSLSLHQVHTLHKRKIGSMLIPNRKSWLESNN